MMITSKDLYSVLTAVVPLYVTMFLAYASVRWWNLFTPEQCSGINRFVAVFAVPLLSFDFISRINPFHLHLPFLAADATSKLLSLLALLSWAALAPRGSLDWCITAFSLASLPNTLVLGIPLLKSMYGDDKENLMVQVVVLQCVIWYTLLLFLFEYRAARLAAMQGTAAASAARAEDDGVVVDVGVGEGVAKPSPERAGQVFNKVVPDSGQLKAEERGGGDLHVFFWRCSCCVPHGHGGQTLQACGGEEEVRASGKETRGSSQTDVGKASGGSPAMSTRMVRVILRTVWFKLVRNPNSYASLLGLSWALVSSRWNIKKPQIMEGSVTILSNAGLGMAMFSLGLFMAQQPRIVACGYRQAAYGMVLRFVAGPVTMAIASVGVGLRGTTLKLSIVQAALPQGIVPFVFAREYNLHPDVLSTAVIFGMIVSLPITVLYYVLLSFYGG